MLQFINNKWNERQLIPTSTRALLVLSTEYLCTSLLLVATILLLLYRAWTEISCGSKGCVVYSAPMSDCIQTENFNDAISISLYILIYSWSCCLYSVHICRHLDFVCHYYTYNIKYHLISWPQDCISDIVVHGIENVQKVLHMVLLISSLGVKCGKL